MKNFANEIWYNFYITLSAMNVITNIQQIKTNKIIDEICDEYIEVDYLVHHISLNSFFGCKNMIKTSSSIFFK